MKYYVFIFIKNNIVLILFFIFRKIFYFVNMCFYRRNLLRKYYLIFILDLVNVNFF